jgi:hypothetical protein
MEWVHDLRSFPTMEAVIQTQGSPFGDEHDERGPASSVPPSFGVAAVASVAGFRDSHGNFPLDGCVPVRTKGGPGDALDWRACLVLLHVDGARSLQDIAKRTDITLSDTIAACLDLVAHGVVELSTTESGEEANEH